MRGVGAAVTIALVLAGSGCDPWYEQSRMLRSGLRGNGPGAAAGAAIGRAFGGWDGAGDLAGTTVGFAMEQQANDLRPLLDGDDRIARDGETLRVALASDDLFPAGGAQLDPGGEVKVEQIAAVLRRYPRTRIEIVANTDARGTEAASQRLSDARAASVRDVLVRNGVSLARLDAHGAGAGSPVAPNDTPSGRAANRRVDLIIQPDAAVAAGAAFDAASPDDGEPR